MKDADIDYERMSKVFNETERAIRALPREEQLRVLGGLIIMLRAPFTMAAQSGVLAFFTVKRDYGEFVDGKLAEEARPLDVQDAEVQARAS